MPISVGLELNNEGRVLAWALDFPGCFAYGDESPEALVSLAKALVDYQDWANRHAGREEIQLGDFDLRVVDTWQVYTIDDQYNLADGGYAVNAWFRHDWKPVGVGEIRRGQELLRWSREDFLTVIASLSDEELDRPHLGERWPIRGIVRHVANAEWWYLDRLGLAVGGKDALPKETMDRLHLVRQRWNEVLPTLAGLDLVRGKEGEFWSPRKLLRRTLWHEIDHRQHILKLLHPR